MADSRLKLIESKTEALNETQKKLIEGYLQFPFNQIFEKLSEEVDSLNQ